MTPTVSCMQPGRKNFPQNWSAISITTHITSSAGLDAGAENFANRKRKNMLAMFRYCTCLLLLLAVCPIQENVDCCTFIAYTPHMAAIVTKAETNGEFSPCQRVDEQWRKCCIVDITQVDQPRCCVPYRQHAKAWRGLVVPSCYENKV